MRTQRETNRNTPSLSTMGYLTMIIALAPTIAAFSGLEQPLRKAPAAAGFAPGTGARTILRRGRSGRSQLNYITDKSSEQLAEPTSTSSSRSASSKQQWWSSIFSREQSGAADDYLEFLSKRYGRMTEEPQQQQQQEPKGFAVLNWLYQTGGEDSTPPQKHHEEDALYVLGVANLASKKLLQKHHLLPEEDKSRKAAKTTASPVTDAEIVDPAPVAKVSLLFRQVAQRRERFLQSQMRYSRLALAFAVRSMLTGPQKALRKLYAAGGGSKSVALTFAALATLSFLLRPLAQAAASDVTGGAMAA